MVAVSLKKKIFFKQKTAYEISTRDWSSDVCSSDLDDKITLDNAVNDTTGKIIEINNIINDPNNAVKKALGMMATGTPAETANATKKVQVALVNIENAKKDASLQAALVRDDLVPANNVVPSSNRKYVEPSKLGSAKTSDGKYILVVTDIVDAA